MTIIGFTIILPQLQELSEFLPMIVMEDASDLIADEQFLRSNMPLLNAKSCQKNNSERMNSIISDQG
jgi:hypothetical protein